MPRVNYVQRWRGSGMGCMMSTVCSLCYALGKREAFFGVAPNGRTLWGIRAVDQQFQKEVWQACQKHLKIVHDRKIVSNKMGGWKSIRLGEEVHERK